MEGDYHGIPLRFIDTPGLVPSADCVGHNERVLNQARGPHPTLALPDNMMWRDEAFRTGSRVASLKLCLASWALQDRLQSRS